MKTGASKIAARHADDYSHQPRAWCMGEASASAAIDLLTQLEPFS
jgi:hypothetical protein